MPCSRSWGTARIRCRDAPPPLRPAPSGCRRRRSRCPPRCSTSPESAPRCLTSRSSALRSETPAPVAAADLCAPTPSHNCGIVLAGDADQRTGVGERCQQLLIQAVQLRMAREIPRDRVRPNLAGDAVPQGVVQIGDDAFLRRRRQQRQRQLRCELVGMLIGVRQPGVEIALQVEARVPPRPTSSASRCMLIMAMRPSCAISAASWSTVRLGDATVLRSLPSRRVKYRRQGSVGNDNATRGPAGILASAAAIRSSMARALITMSLAAAAPQLPALR